MADTALMSIPGQVDPVPVARPGMQDGITPREDGRVDLMGLPKARITDRLGDPSAPKAVSLIAIHPPSFQVGEEYD